MTPEWVTKHQWSDWERAWTYRQSCECSLCATETAGIVASQRPDLAGLMQPVKSNSVTYDQISGYHIFSQGAHQPRQGCGCYQCTEAFNQINMALRSAVLRQTPPQEAVDHANK